MTGKAHAREIMDAAWEAYCRTPIARDCGRSKVDAAVAAALEKAGKTWDALPVNASDGSPGEEWLQPGQQPISPSDGTDQTRLLIQALTMAVDLLADKVRAQNERITILEDRVSEVEGVLDEDEDDGLGVDMAGNPIRIS